MKRFLVLILAMGFLMTACAGKAEVVIPDIETAEFEIPDNPAMAFLRELGCGWNLGNTMDAYDDHFRGDDLAIEKYWCGVYTDPQVFKALKEAGFSTVRIPVSWHNHLESDGVHSNTPWLDRVQELVDEALAAGLYVIINSHHDDGVDWYYPDNAHRESSIAFLTGIWSQVAERFRDYDEHLIFESMNEPRMKGNNWEWWLDRNQQECRDAVDCINAYNQTFVDVVRASGGKNAERYLMVTPYDASAANAAADDFVLPTDTADNRIIVSVHAYVPYSMALDLKGGSRFTTEDRQQKEDVDYVVRSLYHHYIAKGIPVVLGEFGCLDKNNLQDRVDLTAYYVANATARNIPMLWWDNHAFSGGGEKFGLLDRRTFTWKFPEIVETIMRYRLAPLSE